MCCAIHAWVTLTEKSNERAFGFAKPIRTITASEMNYPGAHPWPETLGGSGGAAS